MAGIFSLVTALVSSDAQRVLMSQMDTLYTLLKEEAGVASFQSNEDVLLIQGTWDSMKTAYLILDEAYTKLQAKEMVQQMLGRHAIKGGRSGHDPNACTTAVYSSPDEKNVSSSIRGKPRRESSDKASSGKKSPGTNRSPHFEFADGDVESSRSYHDLGESDEEKLAGDFDASNVEDRVSSNMDVQRQGTRNFHAEDVRDSDLEVLSDEENQDSVQRDAKNNARTSLMSYEDYIQRITNMASSVNKASISVSEDGSSSSERPASTLSRTSHDKDDKHCPDDGPHREGDVCERNKRPRTSSLTETKPESGGDAFRKITPKEEPMDASVNYGASDFNISGWTGLQHHWMASANVAPSTATMLPASSSSYPSALSALGLEAAEELANKANITQDHPSIYWKSLYNQGIDPVKFQKAMRVASSEKIGPGRYSCNQCGKTYAHYKDFIHHERDHLQPYKCSQCSKIYRSEARFKEHMQTHDTNYVKVYHSCPKCDKVFTIRYNMLVHLKQQHLGWQPAKRHVCTLCGKSFQKPYMLKDHEEKVHAN